MWRKLCLLLLCFPVLLAPASAERADVEVPPHLGYGMMLAYPPAHLRYVREAGFDWYKYFIYWDRVDPERDRHYNWDSVNWLLEDACKHGLHLLLRVERDPDNWTPIQDAEMPGWEAFFADLAAHIAVRRAACPTPYKVALEIWNEPNLDFQWGYQPVDPVRYTEMVRRAYRGAKGADPRSFIVAGGLAPTGGMPEGRAMNDVDFLRAMYAAGLQGHFDAISTHNYGFGSAPEDKAAGWGILNFRRAEDIYQVMVDHGDGDKPVWGTEFGWLLESPGCSAIWHATGFGWQQVTASDQAEYLRRAFDYADVEWPWMQVMIVSNLDFAALPWYADCDPLRWFSVRDPGNNPRAAYTALAQMPKRPRSWATLGMELEPPSLSWMMTVTETGAIPLSMPLPPAQPASTTATVSRTVTVRNTGELPFRWAAMVSPGVLAEGAGSLPVTVDPAEGACDESFTVTVEVGGLVTGVYAATLAVTADQVEMPDNPRALTITLHVVDRIERVYLPLAQRVD